MSHFTRVRTQLRSMDTVKEALVQLGYTVDENTEVRGYMGSKAKADLVVRTDNNFDIGFRRDGEQIVLIGDFWGLRIDRNEFMNQLAQRYAYITVTSQANAGGWQTTTEEVQADGSIRLVMQRWA